MALTRLNTFATGSVVTNTIITGEFDNIYNNALTLISPLTANLAAGGFIITGLGLGSTSSPSLQFTGDTNTGIYSSAADTLDLVSAGVRQIIMYGTPTTGIVVLDPSALSATASTSVARLLVGGTSALTIPAGTTAIVAGLRVEEPNITATGTVTRAATAYFVDAPTEGGTANFTIWSDAGPNRFDGTCYINDELNANATLGLTINQGASDDEILALKSSDVAHGVTAATETDTYGFLKKQSAANGGLLIAGLVAAGTVGIELRSTMVTAITTKLTSSVAGAYVDVALKSGTGRTGSGADANLVAIADNGTTRFLFDAEGSAHADVEWIAFQDHDDVTLLRNLERELAPGRVLGAPTPERQALQALGLVAPDGPTGARGLVNMSRVAMLQAGVARQAHDVIDVLLDDLIARRPLTPQERARIPAGIRQRRGL